jgi:hypothetical protein
MSSVGGSIGGTVSRLVVKYALDKSIVKPLTEVYEADGRASSIESIRNVGSTFLNSTRAPAAARWEIPDDCKTMSPLRILSLDGGGVRGRSIVAGLKKIEQATGRPVRW